MTAPASDLWAGHALEWRDPREVTSGWEPARNIDPRLLRGTASQDWWELLEQLGITLIVTREYEHLVMALSSRAGKPAVSYLRLPHPSGLAVDRAQGILHLASTRNPNQVIDFAAVGNTLRRSDISSQPPEESVLVPRTTRFFPGCTYMHDLALIGEELHVNAVGHNAVARLRDGSYERVWWPRAIETPTGPDFSRNYLQLNSIAAGASLEQSFFSASTDRMSRRRPGHRNFPVDGRGVIFSGATREPLARGLTRPHSARLHSGSLWVANSGYGELATVSGNRVDVHARLGGWTRGLCFHGVVAFVGTSRVIPRFSAYAPGLRAERARCSVHAIDVRSGSSLASYTWPAGNQIFAVEWLDRRLASGFPFRAGVPPQSSRWRAFFYSYDSQTVRTDKYE